MTIEIPAKIISPFVTGDGAKALRLSRLGASSMASLFASFDLIGLPSLGGEERAATFSAA
jgi:hypothetical protein